MSLLLLFDRFRFTPGAPGDNPSGGGGSWSDGNAARDYRREQETNEVLKPKKQRRTIKERRRAKKVKPPTIPSLRKVETVALVEVKPAEQMPTFTIPELTPDFLKQSFLVEPEVIEPKWELPLLPVDPKDSYLWNTPPASATPDFPANLLQPAPFQSIYQNDKPVKGKLSLQEMKMKALRVIELIEAIESGNFHNIKRR